jgi:hypothetical protein
MNLKTMLDNIDENTARSMVEAVGRVFDALVIESERIQQSQTPPKRDYNTAELSRAAPGGGWISDSNLRRAAQDIAEAVAQEQWTKGLVSAVRWLRVLN